MYNIIRVQKIGNKSIYRGSDNYVFIRIFFFKQKTAYEMRISDWSSDVCSSDLEVGKLVHILAPSSPLASGERGEEKIIRRLREGHRGRCRDLLPHRKRVRR